LPWVAAGLAIGLMARARPERSAVPEHVEELSIESRPPATV
jgi:hypothetical protein